VLRTGRTGLATATLIADVLKGTAAVLLASWWCGQDFGQDCGLIAGLGAFLGHLFPVWLKFKGGKGIATGLGILLAVSWQTAIAVAIIWIAIAAASRYSSLASLIASAAAPVILWFIGTPAQALLFLILGVLAFIVHRGNIARLMNGTEGRIGQKG
jgi:glycerol-3-phosphate acyltransferase PlsY